MVALAALCAPGPLLAHDGGSLVTLDPWLLGPLLLLIVWYTVGFLGLGGRPGAGRAAAFGTGCAALALALVWPLDAWGERSLAAHMAQHMLLVAVAPPLLLAGLPAAVMLAALPRRTVRAPPRRWRRAWRAVSSIGAATVLQWLVVWGWHAPAALARALASEPVHYAMHASFVGAGLLFWHALLRAVREPAVGLTGTAAAIVVTMMQMGLLGALLTFSGAPLYAHYPQLADQQLAGLIMWIPGAAPYLVGGLVLTGLWLRRGERVC